MLRMLATLTSSSSTSSDFSCSIDLKVFVDEDRGETTPRGDGCSWGGTGVKDDDIFSETICLWNASC